MFELQSVLSFSLKETPIINILHLLYHIITIMQLPVLISHHMFLFNAVFVTPYVVPPQIIVFNKGFITNTTISIAFVVFFLFFHRPTRYVFNGLVTAK